MYAGLHLKKKNEVDIIVPLIVSPSAGFSRKPDFFVSLPVNAQ